MICGAFVLGSSMLRRDEVPTAVPDYGDDVEVVASNIAFVAPQRPDGLFWTTAGWARMLREANYEGLEVHRFTTEAVPLLGAPIVELIQSGMVRSFHQSIRGDGDGVMGLVLPGTAESIGQLHAAQEQSGSQTYPVVVFPQANLPLLEKVLNERYFASMSAEPEPTLFQSAGVKSMNELREWLAERGMRVCWATFHYQESMEAFGTQALGAWDRVLPDIASKGTAELEEIHLEIGRIDGSLSLRDTTMNELTAFIRGSEPALKTVSGRMLQTIFQNTPLGERPRVVVEINQAGLLQYLGAVGIWPLVGPIIDSHRRVVQTVRELAGVKQ